MQNDERQTERSHHLKEIDFWLFRSEDQDCKDSERSYYKLCRPSDYPYPRLDDMPTWVNFNDLSLDIEKVDYPHASCSGKPAEVYHFDQTQVFTGSFLMMNVMLHSEYYSFKEALKLPQPI